MLSGEQSHIRDYWKLQGDKALAFGVKGVIIMVCRLTADYGQTFPLEIVKY